MNRDRLPTRKVGAGALAGAITVIVVWAVETFAHVTIPATVAAALTTVLTFVAGYFVREA